MISVHLSVLQVLVLLLPILIPFLTDLVTKANAPASVKRLVTLVLAAAAGAVATAVVSPDETWQQYVAGILYATAAAFLTHSTGVTQPVQDATPGFGIGPAAPDPVWTADPALDGPESPSDSTAYDISTNATPPLGTFDLPVQLGGVEVGTYTLQIRPAADGQPFITTDSGRLFDAVSAALAGAAGAATSSSPAASIVVNAGGSIDSADVTAALQARQATAGAVDVG